MNIEHHIPLPGKANAAPLGTRMVANHGIMPVLSIGDSFVIMVDSKASAVACARAWMVASKHEGYRFISDPLATFGNNAELRRADCVLYPCRVWRHK
tara:strand:+ start:968 stop:1258 length:291 start_codon:yes stop_codon:yes gene_type:complete